MPARVGTLVELHQIAYGKSQWRSWTRGDAEPVFQLGYRCKLRACARSDLLGRLSGLLPGSNELLSETLEPKRWRCHRAAS
eukprot:7385523-Prymnesium_polylepis.1